MMAFQGVFVERGIETGDVLDVGNVMGSPVDIEILNNAIHYVTTAGNVFPESAQQPLNGASNQKGGSELKNAKDVEFLGNGSGYIVLDRFGRINTFGSATHRGDTLFVQEVRFGQVQVVSEVPIAADLEVVEDPANPGDSRGYYIADQKGNFTRFGNVTNLPSVPADFAPIVATEIEVDASGNTTGYVAMNYLGQIITWSNGTGFSTPTAPIRTQGEPLVIDFVRDSGNVFILNEIGELFGPQDMVRLPQELGSNVGFFGFVDIETNFNAITAGDGNTSNEE